ncbi:MAG: anthranilate synthase component I [Phycisphaerae bacterium]|nr:anthranilate synthase component I [Phycisphaerae bacterium]
MSSIRPTPAELRRAGVRDGTVPLCCTLLGDALTPVTAFERLARGARHAFLLESVVGGEKIARYSFVGANPSRIFQAHDRLVRIHDGGGRAIESCESLDPLASLERTIAEFGSPRVHRAETGLARLPRFTGGAVGYAAYDAVRYVERLARPPHDDRRLPDLEFGLYDTMAVFDHVNKTVLVISHAHVGREGLVRAHAAASRRIESVIAALGRARSDPPILLDDRYDERGRFTGTMSRGRFEDAVRRAKEYILAGDVFQVVLSQRLRAATDADPFAIYRALRVVNPSPFMFFLRGPSCTLIGASPEILCRVEDGVVTSRPLAGTRRRGRTEAEDAALERELRADPKDRAEHIMLVDLARNDVGRVAEPGSITLSDLMSVERYSHVMHLCSNVQGRLAAGRTPIDALRAALPVGTVSGAPKVRAMEIIDGLEPVRRGPYGGAVGYIDFSGNMDTCIALRTMVVTRASSSQRRSGRRPKTVRWFIDIQAGAGIVADSQPAAEYEESMNKARALLAAVRLAERSGAARRSRKRR